MNKIERFYNSLGEPTEANNGDLGYFVTVGDLVKNGGENEFFRKVRKSDKKVSKAVFMGWNMTSAIVHIMPLTGTIAAAIAGH